MKNKLARDRIEDGIAENVRGQQVAGELHAAEFEAENLGQRMCQRRLAHTGNVLDQEVPARQQATKSHAHGLVLAQKDRVEPGQHIIDRNAHAS